MDVLALPGRRRCRLRGRAALALLTLCAGPLLVVPGPAAAAPVPVAAPPSAQSMEELRLRESEAAGDLEDSSQDVRDAAAKLAGVNAQLATARADVAKAKGELVGAQAKVAAARAELARAEAAREAAEAQVRAASVRVEQGREDVGRMARRAYTRGRLDDLRQLMEAAEPADAVERADMLRSVFRFQNRSLDRLTDDRLDLAVTEAGLTAQERAVDAARARAEEGEARARQITADAEAAAVRVEALVVQQQAALAEAEQHRAQDARDYETAQAASRALAEQIRQAAARAEAARKAAAEKAAREAAAAAAAEARRRAAAGQRPAPAPAAAPARDDGWLWPAPGRLTSRYGYRTHPIYGDTRFHAGIDIGGGLGARVSATDDGYVTYAGPASGYGTLVVISHGTVGGRDLSSAYAHMGSISVRTGQLVTRGQRVGSIGNEGNSTGPHLHFEVRLDGEPVDPLGYVSPP